MASRPRERRVLAKAARVRQLLWRIGWRDRPLQACITRGFRLVPRQRARQRRRRVSTTRYLAPQAERIVEAHDGEKPLFMYLAFTAPHTPFQAPQEYIDKYKHIADENRRIYAAMISVLDDGVGKWAALERQGMRDNTLILFHSDNGGVKNVSLPAIPRWAAAPASTARSGWKGYALRRWHTRRCPRQLAGPRQGRCRRRNAPCHRHLSDAAQSSQARSLARTSRWMAWTLMEAR